ncbi:MAG: glucose-6-phosphate isomerase [Legionellales bacterium]|nr:glucose-6-phosphate isomerase [Legionellales bacterium]
MTEETYGPQTAAWSELKEKAVSLGNTSITSMFKSDPKRGERFSQAAAGIFLDFSRQHLDVDSYVALLALADQTNVKAGIERMFSGERINSTENLPAMHIALRQPVNHELFLDGENVMPLIEAEQKKMRLLVDKLRSSQLYGYTGKPITDVVNIGIGGSHIGPLMTTNALSEYQTSNLRVHFISGIGGAELFDVLDQVQVETTLFIVCSKSFATPETLINAQVARDWAYSAGGGDAVEAQFIGISSNHEAMTKLGIAKNKQILLWSWVGGRYSIWSGVGLALALTIGWEHFMEFLVGAHKMDKHFMESPIDKNLPILLALIGIWNRNFLGIGNHAILPYHYRLRFLPTYFQQLEMESNGKSIRSNGEPVQCATSPVVWGELGSNAQHSFYQLLHQGNEKVSIDFFLPVLSDIRQQKHHDILAANCFAQSWGLSEGDCEGDSPYQNYSGNRPSSLILFERLDPATLGSLIALYEHKVYVQGLIWDINSFDQWGVQLGKRLVTGLEGVILDETETGPPVLAAALEEFRKWRKKVS